MALFFQLRRLKQEVQRQLDDVRNQENGGSPSPDVAHQHSRTPSDAEEAKEDDERSSDKDGKGEKEASSDPYARIPGIESKTDDDGSQYYVVSFTGPEDLQDPHNWSTAKRLKMTMVLFFIAFVVTCASSIDSAVLEPAAMEFHVALVVEALGGTGIFLVGFGVGSLFASPLSELFGRYPVYLGSLAIFGIWEMASALSPNIAAQIVFRGLAGVFASAPLTVAGGTISDLWNPKEKTWAFPVFGIAGFGGPIMGPVIAGYVGFSKAIDWRWADWLMLIFDGVVIVMIIALKEETLAPQLLKYKASYFRKITGDDRFKAAPTLGEGGTMDVLKRNFSRPFVLALEPIVMAFTLYLTVIYIVLFTFLDGYTYIFSDVYGTNAGLTEIIFLGLFVGIVLQAFMVPLVYKQTVAQLKRDKDPGDGTQIRQELRLLFAMYAAPLIPIGLFWMAWTCYSHISIWSPIIASVVIGFGIISIFLSGYMYIIDSYEVLAASALTFATLVRYIAAGGMTVVGVPFYENLGPHYTLTILACISAAVVPIPYLLYIWGPKIREKSKYAKSPGS